MSATYTDLTMAFYTFKRERERDVRQFFEGTKSIVQHNEETEDISKRINKLFQYRPTKHIDDYVMAREI